MSASRDDASAGWTARCIAYRPAFDGCHSQGDTLGEAVDRIRKAVEAHMEIIAAHSVSIPRDDWLIKPLEVAM